MLVCAGGLLTRHHRSRALNDVNRSFFSRPLEGIISHRLRVVPSELTKMDVVIVFSGNIIIVAKK